jgi:hypothetical protein
MNSSPKPATHRHQGFLFIAGGPINGVLTRTMQKGIRGVDVRHEQAAAMSAHAYARHQQAGRAWAPRVPAP